MPGKSITLFRILGFEVHVDLSWLVLALLVTWSLASGLFPRTYEGLTQLQYWAMGTAGAVGLFASILFHEFCHSLVARRYGLPMKGITLFIFGGVAEMDDEPPGPKAEFAMAIAGPLSSVLLGILFFFAAKALALPVTSDPARFPAIGVLGYLAVINWVLAVFNLLPAFPLDGGRVLRAALWHWKKDLRQATRIASRLGEGFGLAIMLLGILNVLLGSFIGGLWQVMIGMFLRSAAQMSYQQVLYRKSLEGATVSRFMDPRPVAAPAALTIRQFVDSYLYRYQFKMFPVEQDGMLIGCISTDRVKNIPSEQWDLRTVAAFLDTCSPENSIPSDTDAMKAFSFMGRTGRNRLLVVDQGKLVGVITLRGIMGYLTSRMELEEAEEKKAA